MIAMDAQMEKPVHEFPQLTPEKRAAAAELIRRLKQAGEKTEKMTFLAAVDEFMDEHPEQLRRRFCGSIITGWNLMTSPHTNS